MKKPSNRRVSRLRGRAERMVERRGGDVRPTICRYVEEGEGAPEPLILAGRDVTRRA
jgi:hypothetical protein